ncbi:cation transporter [Silvibacterium dinghuense]|uniref:Cation transporter n=1 Tax=Silvibacterium dinghuense TaxID=1560006 RepID=A0A4V1NW01_9BACT|nr:cation diffusion facilitator family transporter [Silvibacterium dinghuense]RXS97702.1 cation transporter [Silvibacterium dinghuense]GGH01292.1 cation transporter [Silvibacterium dinghuense]
MHVHVSSTGKMQRILRISLAATLGYVALTLLAGLRAHSLALVSEAGHNASDALALLLSFVAVHFQSRPATDEKTFGYQRAGVLAAFLNALTLILLSLWITFEAIHRFTEPAPVQPRIMMLVAAAGVLMNGVVALMLWKVSHDVNMRSVFVHMLGDTLSTAAVIVGGVVIWFTGRSGHAAVWIDPALSLGIAALILWSSIGIVRETLNILLEGTPRGVSLMEIRTRLVSIEGVQDVHDLHVWSLGSQTSALASHVTIADIPPSESALILEQINGTLKRYFRIHHTTIQFEHTNCPVAHGCVMPVDEVSAHSHHHGHSHDGHNHDHEHSH